jgi:MOSC domain
VWKGRTVHTGIWKDLVPGRSRVDQLNVEGDGQGDLAGHGGEHHAVFVYQVESYRYWQEFLKRADCVYGQFGENFTLEGLPDDEVCVGDRYRSGSARFAVTQPRVTCDRVGIRRSLLECRSPKPKRTDDCWPMAGLVQRGARRHGNAGISGSPGNLVSVSCRIYRTRSGSNPTLSATKSL